jgi:hypothetical protein
MELDEKRSTALHRTGETASFEGMDANTFVAHIRNHYVDQFESFLERQTARHATGTAEVKIKLGQSSQLFRQLYCVDFAKNTDGQLGVVQFQPKSVLGFPPIAGEYGELVLNIEALRWDDVVIHHDLRRLPGEALEAWFQQWFDPDDERLAPDELMAGVIHSLLVMPGELTIDFGTAPADAFWALVDLLEIAGATELVITSSEAE